jgi:hypothetical protein
MEDFEAFGIQSRQLSGALLIALSTLVHLEQRTQWEEYAVTEQGWIQDSLNYLQDANSERKLIAPFIHKDPSSLPA